MDWHILSKRDTSVSSVEAALVVGELAEMECTDSISSIGGVFIRFSVLLNRIVFALRRLNCRFFSCFSTHQFPQQRITAIYFSLLLTALVTIRGRGLRIHAHEVVQGLCDSTGLTYPNWNRGGSEVWRIDGVHSLTQYKETTVWHTNRRKE